MSDRERNEKGHFESVYSDTDFLEAIRELQPATTTEVANAVGCTRQNADYRLGQLNEQGVIVSKKAGPSTIWMLLEREN